MGISRFRSEIRLVSQRRGLQFSGWGAPLLTQSLRREWTTGSGNNMRIDYTEKTQRTVAIHAALEKYLPEGTSRSSSGEESMRKMSLRFTNERR